MRFLPFVLLSLLSVVRADIVIWGWDNSETCPSTADIGPLHVANSSCFDFTANGLGVSGQVSCDDLTLESGWTVSVYSGSGCSGDSFATLHGDTGNSCAGASYLGYSISAKVNCYWTGGDSTTTTMAPDTTLPYSSTDAATTTTYSPTTLPDTTVYPTESTLYPTSSSSPATTKPGSTTKPDTTIYPTIPGDTTTTQAPLPTTSSYPATTKLTTTKQPVTTVYATTKPAATTTTTPAYTVPGQTTTNPPDQLPTTTVTTETPQPLPNTCVWAYLQNGNSASCGGTPSWAGASISNAACVNYNINGLTVSGRVYCSGSSSSDSWSHITYMGADCSGSIVGSSSGASNAACDGVTINGQTISFRIDCSAIDYSNLDYTAKQPSSWGYLRSWSGNTCNNDPTITAINVGNNECYNFVVGGAQVSARLTCASTSADSNWQQTLFLSSGCTGSPAGTLTGSGASSCKSATFGGYTFSSKVDCSGDSAVSSGAIASNGNPPTSNLVDNRFPSYCKAWSGSSCSGNADQEGTRFNGDCVAWSASGKIVSGRIQCGSNSVSSSWAMTLYEGGLCSGRSVGSVAGLSSSSCSSATDSTFGTISASIDCSNSLAVNGNGGNNGGGNTIVPSSAFNQASVTMFLSAGLFVIVSMLYMLAH